MKKLFLLLMLGILFPCSNALALDDVRIPENRVIYEVFVRYFSQKGDFKGVQERVADLKDLGVDVIWLMPIYELGDPMPGNQYSSPYAIKNYIKVNPDLGTEQDLHDLISAIHEAGMDVWFDWVGNHTATNNVWVKEHPEYYQKNNGAFVHPSGWNDVYQLDVNSHAMHLAMIEAMQYWVDEFDIDGYRCDYASGPSDEFWKEATSSVTKNGARIAWLAEDNQKPQLVANGWFDYNWTWDVWGAMYNYAQGSGNLNNLRTTLAKLHTDSNYANRSRVMYTSSHDVVQDNGDRWMGDFEKNFIALQFTAYGCPVIYNGQETGYHFGQVGLFTKTNINWNSQDADMKNYFKTLIDLKHKHPSLRTGALQASYTELSASTGNNNWLAYRRGEGENAIVVLMNFNSKSSSITINSGLPTGKFYNIFTLEEQEFTEGSNTVNVGAVGSCAIFVSKNAQVVDPHYIYIENKTGWIGTGLYAWGDNNSIFGPWPGLTAAGTEEIDGTLYEKYLCPQAAVGLNLNLIYNNRNTGNNALGFQCADYKFTVEDKDYYFVAEGMNLIPQDEYVANAPSLPYLYLNNLNKKWSDLHVYAFGDSFEELFGPWPGKSINDSDVSEEIIEGTSYYKIRMPFIGDYSFIFNDGTNGGAVPNNQFDGPSSVITQNDVYLNVNDNNASVAHKGKYLYIRNLSSWPDEDIEVYAYQASGSTTHEIFGKWGGQKSTGNSFVGDEAYLSFPMQEGHSGTFNLIIHVGDDKYESGCPSINVDDHVYMLLEDDGSNKKATILDATGINEIEADRDDEAQPIYYNLQGMRVENPSNGIFIRIRGKKTDKVLK